jgi:glycosyltransferase involved in cell wall biosynthesis
MERNEVRIAYAVANVIIVPSLYLDPFPRIVIEGMATGKPIVGTCYGGAPEIIENGVTGYVVDPHSVKELANKTIDLLRNPKKAEEFGRAGYERVKEKFNLDDKVKEYIVVYESVIKEKNEKLLYPIQGS